jgi:hypothetical protein
MLVINVQAQDTNLQIKSRKKFVSIKTIPSSKKDLIKDKIVLPNDTLVYLKEPVTEEELDYYCKCFKKESILLEYFQSAFTKERKGYSSNAVSQWNSKITVHLASDIPKSVKDGFKSFLKEFSGIKNLVIDFSKNPSQSNYHILGSKNALKQYENDEGDLDINYAYSGVTYNLISDNNNKFYSGRLRLDLQAIPSEELLLKKIKQFFFLSLGNFRATHNESSNGRLINVNYDNSNKLHQIDLDLLKLHYFKIHDYVFTKQEFSDLYKTLKQHCIK